MKFTNTLIAICITSLVGGVVLADNKYKTTTHFKSDFQTMDWNGEKVTVGTLKGVVEVHGSSLPNMPNGESIQNCLVRGARKGDSFDSVSNCTVQDKDGDIFYTLGERKDGDLNSGGKGRLKVFGSTGKYKGFTSSCTYLAKYMQENWVVVEADCEKSN